EHVTPGDRAIFQARVPRHLARSVPVRQLDPYRDVVGGCTRLPLHEQAIPATFGHGSARHPLSLDAASGTLLQGEIAADIWPAALRCDAGSVVKAGGTENDAAMRGKDACVAAIEP